MPRQAQPRASTGTAAKPMAPRTPRRSRAAAEVTDSPGGGWGAETTNPITAPPPVGPLPGREAEFAAVLSFIEARLRRRHSRALFVFGACGSGKTSTVIRALRAVHAGSNHCSSNTSSPLNKMNILTPTAVAKRRRLEGAVGLVLAEAGGAAENASAMAELQERFPSLLRGTRAVVQGHYINCADLTPPQLLEKIAASLHAAGTTGRRGGAMESSTQELLEALPGFHSTRRSARASAASVRAAVASSSASSTAAWSGGRLQVFVLDEVEYVRPGTREVLAALAGWSVGHSAALALIFISNTRELGQLPQALLEELAFEAYSFERLREIAAGLAARAIAAQARRRGLAQDAPGLPFLTESLFDFIARKALHDHAGDVRQIAVMCDCVVESAFARGEGAEKTPSSKPNAINATTPDSNGEGRCSVLSLSSPAMESPTRRLSTGTAASTGTPGAQPRASTASLSAAAAANSPNRGASSSATGCPAARASPVTLAGTVRLLKPGAAAEEHLAEHIATMPEQMLYVLSCLIVAQQKQQLQARDNWGGTGTTSTGNGRRRSYAGGGHGKMSSLVCTTSLSRRQIHGLYTGLMGRHHFPSMNAGGVARALDGLADLGVITRPQPRGEDEWFALCGVWELTAVQDALFERGERLRREMEACGLDGSENKFSTILRELRSIVGLAF